MCAETFVIVYEGMKPTSRAYLIDLIRHQDAPAAYAVRYLHCSHALIKSRQGALCVGQLEQPV